MRIMTWNVNGLTAALRKGFLNYISQFDADVVCVQEVRSDVPLDIPKYHQFWNLATRKGYSGTLMLTKELPLAVKNGIDDERFDCEGRVITANLGAYYIVNVYVPNFNTNSDESRREYRYRFDEAFRHYIQTLDKPVVIAGDFNVAHQHIDIYPENQKLNQLPPVFETEERAGFEHLLDIGFVDAFRSLNPFQNRVYSWWGPKNEHRADDKGSRLDYFLVSDELLSGVNEVKYYKKILVSDHCPVVMRMTSCDEYQMTADEVYAERWNKTDWAAEETRLRGIQARITEAARLNRNFEVWKLQRKILESEGCKKLAVRAVSKHSSAAGIDGIRLKTDVQCMQAVDALDINNIKMNPFRYDLLHERGKDCGVMIASARDKALLLLCSYALDPVAEARSDKKSFAFRKGRSALDACSYILLALAVEGCVWVAKFDVSAFFDSMIHQTIIDKVMLPKHLLRSMLNNDMIKSGELYPVDKGISMASSLSPIIGNILLDGLQSHIYNQLYPEGGVDYYDGNMIRFCDDIIVVCKSKSTAKRVMTAVSEFLLDRGLRMNPEKSYIANIAQGFDFLSWHFQKVNGSVTVRPSNGALNNIEHELQDYILGFRGSQREMIEGINMKLGGWAAYHRITDAYDAFRHVDVIVEMLLIQRMRTKYRHWKAQTVLDNFWVKEDKNPVFVHPNDHTIRVIRLATVEAVEHIPIKLSYNPYLDGDYYEVLQQRRREQKAVGRYKAIWRRQDGNCAYCGLPMLIDQEVEVVEKEIGAGDSISNLQYIHRRCAYNIFAHADNEIDEFLDTISTLKELADPHPPKDSPYYELRMYFHYSTKPNIVMTFEKIEAIIGLPLTEDARLYDAFWYDDEPGRESFMWVSEGYRHREDLPERTYCISDSWRTQGYEIKYLNRAEGKVVFRRTANHMSALMVPQALLDHLIPDRYASEGTQMLRSLAKRCGY